MKKLIIVLLSLSLLCACFAPAMATNDSPVKDYDSASEGELLYAMDLSGKDGVLDLGNIGGKHADEHFYFTPSEDGTSVHVYGREDSDDEDAMYTAYWGATIPSLEANFSTTYTLTYKITMHGDKGLNNSVGVGAYFISGQTNDSMSAYHLYGNYCTKAPGNDISMRRSSLSINNMKQAEYVQWNTLDAYQVDADGFVTAMLVYEGSAMTMTAYILAEGAGDGSKESDWIKVEALTYVPADDCMGFMMYAYYINTVDVTVKNVNLYKGKIFTMDAPPETEPTEEPTVTTRPTAKPTQPADGEPAADFPIGLVIGIAAAVVVAVVVVVVIIVIKKKKPAANAE